MKKTDVPPTSFPTQAEIIRFVVNTLDIQRDRKKIDEYVRVGDDSKHNRNDIIDKIIQPVLADSICSKLAESISFFIKSELDDYIQRFVLDKDLCFVQRNDISCFLAQELGGQTLFLFFGSRVSLQERNLLLNLKDNECLFQTLISQLDGDESWQQWYDSLSKENKDKLRNWAGGKSLPSIQSIKLLFKNSEHRTYKRIFILARAIEFFRKNKFGKIALDVARYKLRKESFTPYPYPHFFEPDELLFSKKDSFADSLFEQKGGKDKKLLRQQLDELTQEYYKKNYDKIYGLFELYMFEAQWHVLAGQNKKALEYYKQAFDHGLYRVGIQQKSVIKRSLSIAAIEKDLPFLKRLKQQAIAFGIYNSPFEQDELDSRVNNHQSRSRSNIVEDWEMKQWEQEFHSLFREEMFFDGVKPPTQTSVKQSNEKIKPDYRHVNRRVEISVIGGLKKQPQLLWFISDGKYEVVEKLLSKGASVDVYSEAGDTPLIMSVIKMSKDELDFVGEPDDRFFTLLSTYPHKPETINRRTSKKRLTPLMSAIDTGRVDIVQKLLDMGAEVDRKASVDDITPLYYCITLINRIQNPEKYGKEKMQQLLHPEIVNEMRRYVPTMLSDVDRSSPLFRSIQSTIDKSGYHIPTIDPQAIEQMAILLLNNGANPNCEHNIKGSVAIVYTPLLLAAEFDNAFLFEQILDFGGDIQKQAKYSTPDFDVDIEGICKQFNSERVLQLLRQTREAST
ncbi:MAG: ankyrin repeat domain-containing protein [Flavobacteriales bacterium]|nr:ankyrin repeat domain-containing protein [Flavobacteriales bacterium]